MSWLSSNVLGIVIKLNMKEIEMGYRGSKIITKVVVKEQRADGNTSPIMYCEVKVCSSRREAGSRKKNNT